MFFPSDLQKMRKLLGPCLPSIVGRMGRVGAQVIFSFCNKLQNRNAKSTAYPRVLCAASILQPTAQSSPPTSIRTRMRLRHADYWTQFKQHQQILLRRQARCDAV